MLKILLHIHILCFCLSASFVHASENTNASAPIAPLARTTDTTDTMDTNDQLSDVVSFYQKKLEKVGIKVSLEQVRGAIDLMNMHSQSTGLDLADILAEWRRSMNNEVAARFFYDNLRLYVQKSSMQHYFERDRHALFQENIFKHALNRVINKTQQTIVTFKEDFYAYAWTKLISQYDSLEFERLLGAEIERLTAQTVIEDDCPLFLHLLKIYKRVFLICSQMIAAGPTNSCQNEKLSEALDGLKKFEQNNPRFTRLPIYDKSSSIDEDSDSPDMVSLRKAMIGDIWIANKDRWLKDFESYLEQEDMDVSKKTELTPFRRRLYHELVKERFGEINLKIFNKVCDDVFNIFGETDERILNSRLTKDVRNFVAITSSTSSAATKQLDEEVVNRFVSEGVIEQVRQENGIAKLEVSKRQAPLLLSALRLYNTFELFFETLKKKKIVDSEEFFFSMMRYFEKGGLNFVNFDSVRELNKMINDNLEFFDVISSGDMVTCLEQIRNRRVRKKEISKTIDRMPEQAEKGRLCIIQEETAAISQIAKEKSKERRFLQQKSCRADAKRDSENSSETLKQPFLQSNTQYLEWVKKVRELRQDLPRLEACESPLVDQADDTESECGKADSFFTQRDNQRTKVKEMKILRRTKINDNLENAKEKNKKYEIGLRDFISKLHKQCDDYDEQEKLNSQLLANNRKAYEQESERKAAEYRDQHSKKSVVQKMRSVFMKRQYDLAKQRIDDLERQRIKEETERLEEAERLNFLKTHGRRHDPYKASVLGKMSNDSNEAQVLSIDLDREPLPGSTATMLSQETAPIAVKRHNPYACSV